MDFEIDFGPEWSQLVDDFEAYRTALTEAGLAIDRNPGEGYSGHVAIHPATISALRETGQRVSSQLDKYRKATPGEGSAAWRSLFVEEVAQPVS